MTVAELKRQMIPGTKLTLTNSLLGPCNKPRTVARVNSVDFMLHQDDKPGAPVSHCRWPKASQLVETPKGFRIMEGDEIAVEYELTTAEIVV